MCIAITTNNVKCSLAPKYDYCHIHAKARIEALSKKVNDQRIELTTLNKRCQTLSQKFKIINRLDYIKSRLKPICINRSYRAIVKDYDYCREIEAIFKKPFHDCIIEYEDLLLQRNDIVHPYQKKSWITQPYRRIIYNKTLSELATRVC